MTKKELEEAVSTLLGELKNELSDAELHLNDRAEWQSENGYDAEDDTVSDEFLEGYVDAMNEAIGWVEETFNLDD